MSSKYLKQFSLEVPDFYEIVIRTADYFASALAKFYAINFWVMGLDLPDLIVKIVESEHFVFWAYDH
jgi:hypothetical protein